MSEKFVFRHFFDGLAIGGALAEWGLACWLVGTPPLWLHLLVPPVLAVVNRLAARRLEHERPVGFLAGVAGRVVLGTAFAAFASACVLGALASVAGVVWLLGALSAEAGMLPGIEPATGMELRTLGVVAVGLTSAAVGYGYAWGYRRLVVTHLVAALPSLPASLAGIRIAHVSDLHLGPLADRDAVREALDRVVALDPDVVCVTGDVVDSPATDIDSWIPELARLRARHGVFAILGNHDRHAGAERVAAALRRWTDWRVLRDEVATVEIAGARLHLLGLEDRREAEATDGLAALVARAPAGEPAILLAHRPRVFAEAADAGVRLVFAGHTHGGQVAVPGIPGLNVARLVQTRWTVGCFTPDGAMLHVNRGLGTSGQRLRLGAPREITVVTLVPA